MGKIKLQIIVVRYASKIVHEWNIHLKSFSLPQAIENSRQFFPRKQSLGAHTVAQKGHTCKLKMLLQTCKSN